MKNEDALRQQLAKMLDWGEAHVDFGKSLSDMPFEQQGRVAPGLPHSAWQLLEHLRIALRDILEFSRGSQHTSPKWPEGYWPKTPAPPNDRAWDKSVEAFHQDLKSMQDLVKNPNTDLVAKIPWGEGQTILREALLVADHNAYHIAQIVDARRLLGAWKE